MLKPNNTSAIFDLLIWNHLHIHRVKLYYHYRLHCLHLRWCVAFAHVTVTRSLWLLSLWLWCNDTQLSLNCLPDNVLVTCGLPRLNLLQRACRYWKNTIHTRKYILGHAANIPMQLLEYLLDITEYSWHIGRTFYKYHISDEWIFWRYFWRHLKYILRICILSRYWHMILGILKYYRLGYHYSIFKSIC